MVCSPKTEQRRRSLGSHSELAGAGQGQHSGAWISTGRSPRESRARGALTYVIVGLDRVAAWAGGGGWHLCSKAQVVALPDNSLAEVRDKTASLCASEAPGPVSWAWGAAAWAGGSGSHEL
jgi:hypothetical protein